MLTVGVVMRALGDAQTASSTAALVEAAIVRGHSVYITHPADLSLVRGREGCAVGRRVPTDFASLHRYDSLGESELLGIAELDLLLLRVQPPIDTRYFAACHMLAQLEDTIAIVNRPSALIGHAEKLFAMRFPDLHPETVVSANKETLEEFRSTYGDVVIKPLYDFQGAGVFLLREDDKNLDALLETLLRLYGTPVVMQRYLSEARRGDKRIFLVDGKPVGALNRIPAEGSVRANLHAGGTPRLAQLSDRDHEICCRIGPPLAGDGLLFVGIDVIGDYITEVSIASPTGIVQLAESGGANIVDVVWDALERAVDERRQRETVASRE